MEGAFTKSLLEVMQFQVRLPLQWLKIDEVLNEKHIPDPDVSVELETHYAMALRPGLGRGVESTANKQSIARMSDFDGK